MTDYELVELVIEYSDGEEEDELDLAEYEHVSHGIRFTYCKVCACQKMTKNKS